MTTTAPTRPLLAESDIVINVVWTGRSFELFRPFAESMLRHTAARFRYVGNSCPPDELAVMERFSTENPGRIVEVLDVESGGVVPHGVALDRVIRQRDDGEVFAFIDPDIYAGGPWLSAFLPLLTQHDAVTSGQELWSDSNVEPLDHVGIGVGGRHFYSPDGFTYGSPHIGLYRRSSLLATMDNWDVSLGSAGPELNEAALTAIEALGVSHKMFDTGKIMNILLQAQGGSLVHTEHSSLLHIGGLSHYVSPSALKPGPDGKLEPDWIRNRGVEARALVARHTAEVLAARAQGHPPPPLPADADPKLHDRLERVGAVLGSPEGAALEGPAETGQPWEDLVGFQEAFERYVDENDFTSIDHTVQLTTGGGCATTALVEYFHHHDVDVQPGPGEWPFKHARVAPISDEVPEGFRVLYVIGDPRDAVLSLFRRGYQVGHARAMGHDWREDRRRKLAGLPLRDPGVPILAPATVARLRDLDTYLSAGVDEFDFAGHLDAWLNHPPGYPVMFVRYDCLADRWNDVRDFVGISSDSPPFEVKPRSSSWTDLPRHQQGMLQGMYQQIAEEIAARPPVEIV